MWVFYVLSLIPVVVGVVLLALHRRVVWWECLAGSAVAFLLSGIFHVAAYEGMTGDTETWSGQITHAVYHPKWVEEVEHTEDIKNSKGETVGTRKYYTYTTHHPYWEAHSDINTSKRIDKKTFDQIVANFGGNVKKKWSYKSGFYSGDHNIYPCDNETGYVYPITDPFSFENRIQATPSLWSFPQPPKDTQLFEYPKNQNWFASDRLLGTAATHIELLSFDRMNTRLGGSKKVNLIMVGFPSGTPEMQGHYQEAKWIGGKKNDVVICYGGGGPVAKPEWVYVFGWTEEAIFKEKLESALLRMPVTNDVIPVIESEVRAGYVIKDWSKFDYISIEPPKWSYFVFVVVCGAAQAGFYFWACNNKEDKGDPAFCAFQR